MNNKQRFKQASQKEIDLYCIVGESVCAIQHLEDCISHSIVIKKIKRTHKKEADILLEKQRSFTLGRAVKIIEQDGLFPESIRKELSLLLIERNWLIHKSIAQGRDNNNFNLPIDKLIVRIKSITNKTLKLLHLIEDDLIEFTERNGANMSDVKEKIKKFYSN